MLAESAKRFYVEICDFLSNLALIIEICLAVSIQPLIIYSKVLYQITIHSCYSREALSLEMNMTTPTEQWVQHLSPNVRRAWNHRVKEIQLAPRVIFDYELLYVEKGEYHVRVEAETFTAGPGSILLFKPGFEHEFYSIGGADNECWMPHIHFDVLYYEDFEEVSINFSTRDQCTEQELQFIRPDLLGAVFKFPNVIHVSNHMEIHKCLKQIIHAYERRDADYSLLQKSLVLRIIYLLLKGLKANNNHQPMQHQRALDEVITYMMEHFNEPIALETLSKIACLSVYHFSRIFKQAYGISPHQFQIRYRIDQAKEMLMFQRLSLSSIAEKVGYSNVHSFSKAFKQVEGVSPRHFLGM